MQLERITVIDWMHRGGQSIELSKFLTDLLVIALLPPPSFLSLGFTEAVLMYDHCLEVTVDVRVMWR